MKSYKTVDSLVDEVLSWSNVPPTITSRLRTAISAHYSQSLIMVDDFYPDVVNTLYALNDQGVYSIISLSFVDEYIFMLLPEDKVNLRNPVRSVLKEWKKENSHLSGAEIGEVARQVSTVQSNLNDILRDSTRTTRVATGLHAKEFIMPDVEVMQRFYECGRKHSYATAAEAADHLHLENGIYECSWCHGYHQGHAPTGMTIPREIMEGRWRTAWRRYQGL